MADATIDLELVGGLGLPYAAGAEASLAPEDAAAFDGVSAVAGVVLTLEPTSTLPVEQIADLLAAARQGGIEPPDLFAWYAVRCPEETAEAVAAALAALPFVLQVEVRRPPALPGWQVTSDPETVWQGYLRRFPQGVDAFAAWQVPGGDGRGVRVADAEQGWDLTHPDLAPANVTVLQPMASPSAQQIAHGTACLGILGARSTGAGLTGIAPGATLAVAPYRDPGPDAVVAAAGHVGRGGVVVVEMAFGLTPDNTPDAPYETTNWGRASILSAAALQVLVVEPAGNGAVNLDIDPRVAYLRAFAPGTDSGALMVGSARRQPGVDGVLTDWWMPTDDTCGGARVDCFAAGTDITAPKPPPSVRGFTTSFGGTSGASAIVAGVAAALQGAAIAAGMGPLEGAALRALLRDPQYGRPPAAVNLANPQLIGVMPDLEQLLEGIGVPRLPPATAIRTSPGSLMLLRPRRGDVDQLDVVQWSESAGQFAWSVTSGVNPDVAANGHVVGVCVRVVDGFVAVDVVCPSQTSVVLHRPFVLGGLGLADPWRGVSDPSGESHATDFRLTTPFSVVAPLDRLIVSALSVDGRSTIFMAQRGPDGLNVVPMTSPPTLQQPIFTPVAPALQFAWPPIVYDADGSIVLVGVDVDGVAWFGRWSLLEGWSGLVAIGSQLEPADPPALAHLGSQLFVIALDPSTHLLQEIVGRPDAVGAYEWSAQRGIALPALVTWGAPLDPVGPIAAASDGDTMVMVIGLTAAGLPVATVRLSGLDWEPLFFVPTLTPFVARAGVTVASPAAGVFLAFASDARGALYSARWTLVGWTPFAPV